MTCLPLSSAAEEGIAGVLGGTVQNRMSRMSMIIVFGRTGLPEFRISSLAMGSLVVTGKLGSFEDVTLL